MKLYGNTSNLSGQAFSDLLKYFYPACDKVSIYFPNDAEEPVTNFKNTFLKAIELCELDDEDSVLEPKEGFTMVIASLSDEVQSLLTQIHPSFHLSFGIIKEETLILFIGEEGEIAIDTEDAAVATQELFASFTKRDN